MRKELCNALSLIVTNEKKRLEDERERVRASLTSIPQGTKLFYQSSCRIQALNSELIDCDLILQEIKAPAFCAPRLSDDTANRIRGVLELSVAASRDAASKVDALLFLLPDDKSLIQARLHGVKLLEQALQDLHEFNEVYPKK